MLRNEEIYYSISVEHAAGEVFEGVENSVVKENESLTRGAFCHVLVKEENMKDAMFEEEGDPPYRAGTLLIGSTPNWSISL